MAFLRRWRRRVALGIGAEHGKNEQKRGLAAVCRGAFDVGGIGAGGYGGEGAAATGAGIGGGLAFRRGGGAGGYSWGGRA